MALMNKVNFTRFTRWGVNLGRLSYTAATHEEATDGTDELKITCDEDLTKGERLVWVDRQGTVHEHIVDEIERMHDDSGKPCTSITCINSVNETWDDYVEDKRPSGSVAVALASILEGTRWEVGACDQQGNGSHTFYHISVREALSDLLDVWGGELETVIETDGVQVTRRSVRVRAMRGDQQSPKRFTWTKDLISIKRKTGAANPKTRIYGYGKGVETDTGGYGRRLTFGEINGGKDYVEDASATEVWGHPDGSGGVAPAVDVYINEQCEDAAQLLAETRDYLEKAKTPTVSYEASVLDLFAFGRNWEGVAVGDCVAIIDKGFSDAGIRLKGRVSKISRDLVTGDASVTFGNITDDLADILQSMAQQLKGGTAQRANYDAAAGTSISWLNQLMSALNQAFNSVGTYKIETFELGTIWSNVPIDEETGTPLKATSGMWAVNINGMGMRLAANLTGDGQWNWRTFITGAQVSADCINAGTMRADRIRAGLLTDEAGKNFWDLTTGEFSLSGVALDSDTISSVDVEFAQNQSKTAAPTSGWQTAAPPWRAGYYIWQRTKTVMADGTAAYTAPVCISGRDGVDGKDGSNGIDGKDGVPGAPGKDGVSTYFHRAYATSSDGRTGFSTTYGAGKTYMGTYVDAVQADSSDPSRYQWSKIKGEDGADGIPGVNGADGKTYYLHIAYAESADGKTGFSVTPKATSTYIGQCVDLAVADPTTPASYAWSLIKGADGDDGLGISRVVEQYYLSTSSTTCAGGSWSLTPQTYVSGRYYWTRSVVTWDDNTVTYTTPVLARGLNSANKNAADAQKDVSDLDDSLNQQGIFNRLTNNGATQGIYLSGGKVYINATYLATGTISDASGNNSWNLTNGTLKTKNMTANSITANGTFRCGYTSYYTMLNSSGQMAGYRVTGSSSTATRVGYIDYTASSQDVSTGNIYYGIQVQTQGSLRISSPLISVAATSDRNVTTTYGYNGTLSQPMISEIHDNGNGTIGWHYGTFRLYMINGLVTSYSTVGT